MFVETSLFFKTMLILCSQISVILAICFFSKIPKDLFLIFLLIVLISKLLVGLFNEGGQIKSYIGHLYFYSFIIFGYILGWQLSKASLAKIKISIKALQIAILLTLVICLIYFSLYNIKLNCI